jgi:hypothetical protein
VDHFTATTDPVFGSVAVSAIVALIPLLTFFVLLAFLKVKAHFAGGISLLVAIAVAIWAFKMPAGLALLSATQGAVFGAFPVVWIVIMAIWLYQITVVSGRFEDLRRVFDAIGGGDLSNGFLNRFLLLSTRSRPPERDPSRDPFVVPDDIKRAMRLIHAGGSPALHNGQAVPKVGVVAGGRDGEVELNARMISMSAPHPAIGLTSAVALAAAATIPGSLVHDLAPARPTYRIGTLSGPITVAITDENGNRAAAFRRNSRRIVDALVYIPAATPADSTQTKSTTRRTATTVA